MFRRTLLCPLKCLARDPCDPCDPCDPSLPPPQHHCQPVLVSRMRCSGRPWVLSPRRWRIPCSQWVLGGKVDGRMGGWVMD